MGKRNNPKAILFICEGVSDKDALENLLNEIFNPIRVVPIVYRGDITTSFDQRVIKSEIGNAIKGSLNQDYSSTPALLRLEDLVGVVLLTDTDGCYISDSSMIYDHRYRHPFYQPDVILTDKPENICKRNKRKSKNLNILYSTKIVSITDNAQKAEKRIPFSVYYCSCNLDHIISNDSNMDQSLKQDNALDFAEDYADDPVQFINFLNDGLLPEESKQYLPSWDFIKLSTNSLKRYSNLIVFLIDHYDDLTPEAQQRLRELGCHE